MNAVLTVFHYQTSDKRIPYREWLDTVRNPVAFAAVQLRVDRLERGLFGDCAPIGEGVWELRVDTGAGYWVYYGLSGKQVVLLWRRQANAECGHKTSQGVLERP